MRLNVAIFIFNDVEVLDFAGPFEVFSVASQLHQNRLFNVFTLAENKNPVKAINGLSVNPDYCFETAPKADILIIAGGEGTKALLKHPKVLNNLKTIHNHTTYTATICSGSRIAAVLGLLDGKPYCTHHQVYDDMLNLVPTAIPQKSKRFTNSGKLYTSGGISAGIDLSFHLLNKIYGNEVVKTTASYMEYRFS